MSNATTIHLGYMAMVYLLLIIIGYQIAKRSWAALGWICLLIALSFTGFIINGEQPVVKMLCIIIATFTAMKIIVVAESYRDKAFKLTFFKWVAFALGWAGMRPQAFETLYGKALSGSWLLVKKGIIRILIGLLLLAFAHFIVRLPGSTRILFVINTGLLLVTFSFILHFGLLTVSAGIWRFFGADTYVLFRQPARSNSLSEFWGRRWNLAFIEMLSLVVLRPIKQKIGNTPAVLISFLFSGVLHELAITLPVNAGFGMPTLYFVIQGVAVIAEKIMEKHNMAILRTPFFAKLWLLFWLVTPIKFLFPRQFIEQIIWPLANLAPW